MTIGQFIEANGITMTCKYLGFRKDESGWAHYAWRCVLRMAGRRMQVTFTMGTAYKGTRPEVEDVLDSVASDAAMLEGSGWNLIDFLAETGIDTEDGGERRIFFKVVQQTESLQRLLGHDAQLYKTLLWDTERL